MDDASRYQKDFDRIMQELEVKASQKQKMDRQAAEKFCDNFVNDPGFRFSPERREAIRKRCIELFQSEE